jgi:predicted outer membrane repeat protein
MTYNTATSDGGAVMLQGLTKIHNCTISNNSAGAQGGDICCLWTSELLELVNCAIVNNAAGTNGGGVLCLSYIVLSATNCTLSANSATDSGGGIYCWYDCVVTLNNSILWENTATNMGDEIYIDDFLTTFELYFCDYANDSGDIEGTGTITPDGNCSNLDPQFVNATAQDYHLQITSPCIDAGDNSLVPSGVTTDLDGSNRIVNGTVDMGAYEYQP